jgi:hypothetical protein
MTGPKVDRLLRWYPRAWCERYGDEFAELLNAEIEEQPQSWRRDLDVRRHGVQARFAAAGFGAGPVRDPAAVRSVQAFALTGFVAATVSLWGQILRGSSAAPYAHPAVAAMRIVIAATLAILGGWAAVNAWGLATRTASVLRTHRRDVVPALLQTGIGLTAFGGGLTIALSNLHERITPTLLSRALTQSISTYWAHPAMLVHSSDGSTVSWTLLSPVAVVLVVSGLVQLSCAVDRITPPTRRRPTPRVPRALMLAPTVFVSAWWVAGSSHYRSPGLQAGTLDLLLIAAMAGLLGVLAGTSRPAA